MGRQCQAAAAGVLDPPDGACDVSSCMLMICLACCMQLSCLAPYITSPPLLALLPPVVYSTVVRTLLPLCLHPRCRCMMSCCLKCLRHTFRKLQRWCVL
jgi:hypothetical protein